MDRNTGKVKVGMYTHNVSRQIMVAAILFLGWQYHSLLSLLPPAILEASMPLCLQCPWGHPLRAVGKGRGLNFSATGQEKVLQLVGEGILQAPCEALHWALSRLC